MSGDKESPDDAVSNLDAVRALFQRVVELPEEDRDAALARSEANADVREHVAQLLKADAASHVDVERIVTEAAEEAANAKDRYIGQDVGRYRISELIDEGGMGRVYLAERTDEQYEQQVAIKILNTHIPSKQLLQRFRSERQILAKLNHPNVSQLLDGGEMEDGLPYLVMEYVDGMPLLEYCEHADLGLRERLKLFVEVCDAIQHAHQNLVVHRDIKSSNIFVTNDGQPKLLDFGIAKLLQPEGMNYTLAATVADARLLTPANASPEQISGDQITVATDVYQLGLLLYELLTGKPAYAVDNLSPGELESMIRETQPARPSDTTTDRLRKTLAGDLDTIVLKALRKNPARRYTSPRELADDLERYLNHEPVRARPDTRMYRIGKFLRRNALSTSAASIIAVLVVSFAVVTYAQNQRIAAERDTATAVSEFMIDIFNLARPEESPGETVTARQVLDSGYERISTDLGDRPEVKAQLLWVMGESYTSLGLHDDALLLLSEAAELGLLGHLPDDDLVDVLANVAQEAGYLDRLEEASRYINLAEEVYARIDNPDPELGKIIFKHHASHLRRSGDFDAGMAKLLRAEEIARTIEDDVHGHYPDMLHELGAWNLMRGEFEEAESWLRRALNHPHPSWRDPTNRRAVTLGVLGSTLRGQGRYPEAMTYMQEALAILEREVGPDHINVGITHGNIAVAQTLMNDLQGAEASSLRAIEITKAALGEDHSRMGTMYGGLATIRQRQDRHAEALELLERSLAIKVASMPPGSASIGLTRRKMGNAYRAVGKHAASLDQLEQALNIFETRYGADSTQTGAVLTDIGLTRLGTQNWPLAEVALRRAAEIYADEPESLERMRAHRGLAELHVAQGDCIAALAAADEAQVSFDSDNPIASGEVAALADVRASCEG